MAELTGAPSHILLNRKDDANSHSTRPLKKGGGAAAFAAYGFGPLDLPDGKNKGGVDASKKAITGSAPAAAMTNGNVGWLTQLAASEHRK